MRIVSFNLSETTIRKLNEIPTGKRSKFVDTILKKVLIDQNI